VQRTAIGVAALLVLFLVGGAEAGEGQKLDVLWAVVLGAIQGATEFLPVSSSGHLSLGQAWLEIDPSSAGHRFNITLHAGTLIAVVWVYRRDVVALLQVLVRPHVDSEDRTRLGMMLLASIPLGIVLIPAVEDLVVRMESSVRAVGIAFWITAAILFAAFRGGRGEGEPSTQPPKAWQAILIGLAQLGAVLPGISRSGSTIAAGIAVGLDRAAAARFSFLISLIAVGGASAKEVLEIVSEGAAADPIDPLPFAAGFVASLVVGLLSLRGLLYLVGRGRIGGFVVYLAVLGAIAIVTG
jgi:undecaprenyl-diphosphatase